MSKYARRDFQVGDFWLSQRDKSPAWYRTWRDGKRTMRQSLETADYETAKTKLTEWFVLNHSPKNEKSEVVMSAVMARYWDKHGQYTVSSNNLRLQLEQWEKHFGKDATVAGRAVYPVARQESEISQDGFQQGASAGQNAARHQHLFIPSRTSQVDAVTGCSEVGG